MTFIKRAILFVISVALLFSISGCNNNTPIDTETDSPNQGDVSDSPAASDSPALETDASLDFEAAYASHAPDTVMMTFGSYELKWDELFFYICNSISYFTDTNEIDLSAIAYDDVTYSQLLLDYATEDAISYKAVYYGAQQLGVSLSDEDHAAIETDYDNAVNELGGEEVLLERLKTYSNIYNIELFKYLISTDMLVSLCFDEMFGTNASKLSDESVDEFVITEGFLKAKHILRLSGDDKPNALEEAEEILSKLDSYSGDDIESYFDELMFENSEDPGGLSSYPDGYLFRPGTMVPEFYDSCAALEVGEYSRVVESSHGYHIIYRLPISFDDVPYEYSSQGNFSTLRQAAASSLFGVTLLDWADSLSINYTDAYNSLSLSDIF